MTLLLEKQSLPLKADANGTIRVGGTRVTLETLVYAFNEGKTAEDIVSRYPVLRLSDVYAVISYYLNNRAQVNDYLAQQTADAEKLWRQIEAMPDYQIFRERLLARQRAQQSQTQEGRSAEE